MTSLIRGLFLALPILLSCSDSRSLWHEQVLPSGKTIKITSVNLGLGAEHDERYPGNDCFALEYVSANPAAAAQALAQEAWEVFELIRPLSEQWGFNTASLAGFPTPQRKGPYEVFVFTRALDGKWACTRYPAKVFAND